MCESICVRIDKFSSTCAWLSFEEVSGSRIHDMKMIPTQAMFIWFILVYFKIKSLYHNFEDRARNEIKMPKRYQIWNFQSIQIIILHLKPIKNPVRPFKENMTFRFNVQMMTNLRVVTLTRERKHWIASYASCVKL